MQDGELRLMLHSFPRVSVMTKSQGFTLLGSKPKTRTGNIFREAKAEDLAYGSAAGAACAHIFSCHSALYMVIENIN